MFQNGGHWRLIREMCPPQKLQFVYICVKYTVLLTIMMRINWTSLKIIVSFVTQHCQHSWYVELDGVDPSSLKIRGSRVCPVGAVPTLLLPPRDYFILRVAGKGVEGKVNQWNSFHFILFIFFNFFKSNFMVWKVNWEGHKLKVSWMPYQYDVTSLTFGAGCSVNIFVVSCQSSVRGQFVVKWFAKT